MNDTDCIINELICLFEYCPCKNDKDGILFNNDSQCLINEFICLFEKIETIMLKMECYSMNDTQ